MILLRYLIRCTLHYSVPLTLGLLAYTGSWQNVARDILTENDAAKTRPPVEIAAAANPETAGPNPAPAPDGAKTWETDPKIPPATPRADESLAMNPSPGEAPPRSLAIPRAQARAVPKEPSDTDRRSDDSARESSEDDRSIRDGSVRPPRDRSIDATGHESPVAHKSKSRAGNEVAPSGVAGAAALALAAAEPRAVDDPHLLTDTKGGETKRTPEDVAKTETTKVASNTAVESAGSDAPKPIDEATPQVTVLADSARSNEPHGPALVGSGPMAESLPMSESHMDSGSIEPAHLNPKIREIAAAVPASPGGTKAESPVAVEPGAETVANQVESKLEATAPPAQVDSKESLVEAIRPVSPATAEPAEPPVLAKKAELPASTERQETTQSAESPTAPTVAAIVPKAAEAVDARGGSTRVPDFVVAKEGETWRRISQRIFGDESMADSLWKENRDAHGESAESPPIAGRMIRLPDLAKRSGKVPHGETHLARTAR